MITCKKCGLLKNNCKCNEQETQSSLSNCLKCNSIHPRRHLKNFGGMEICTACWRIEQLDPAEREYYRTLSIQSGLPLIDMPTHVEAANIKGMPIEDYLKTLPRTREEFAEYWKDQKITIGGVAL